MEDILSFLGVIVLWVAVSIGFWWLNHIFLRRKRRRQRALVAQISATVCEAQTVFDRIRSGITRLAPLDETGPPDEQVRGDTTALLRRIQDEKDFFDRVRALDVEMRKRLGVQDCPPLSEILQIRRDLWAASEIILVEDLKSLGDAFTDERSYWQFCEEARRLLFKGAAEAAGEEDLLDLRLAVARADVAQFADGVEQDLRVLDEKERLPTWRDIISLPVAAARALPGQIRAARAIVLEQIEQVKLAVRTIRESETFVGALNELRRARAQLPGKLAASLEKAAALARHGRASIVAHHAFLIKAHDLQTKYEDLLSRAPELSERGRQFIARLELAKRSEQLREKSKGLVDDLRRLMVKGLAHLIAALQRLQERLAVPEPLPAAGPADMPLLRDLTPPRDTERKELVPAQRAAPPVKPSSEKQPVVLAEKDEEKPSLETAVALPLPPPSDNKTSQTDKRVGETATWDLSGSARRRLRSLFFDRRPAKREMAKARPQAEVQAEFSQPFLSKGEEAAKPAPASPAQMPAAAEPSTVSPPASEQPASREPQFIFQPSSRKKPPADKRQSFWPMLDKLRQPALPTGIKPAGAQKTEAKKPELREPQVTASAAASVPAPVKAKEPHQAPIEARSTEPKAPRRFGLFRRKAPLAEDGETVGAASAPKTKQNDARQKAEPGKIDSIAKILQRLSEEDLSVIAEIRPPRDGEPRQRVSSLISKLSALQTSAFDEGETGTEMAAIAQEKTLEKADNAVNAVTAEAKPRARLSFLGRRKGF